MSWVLDIPIAILLHLDTLLCTLAPFSIPLITISFFILTIAILASRDDSDHDHHPIPANDSDSSASASNLDMVIAATPPVMVKVNGQDSEVNTQETGQVSTEDMVVQDLGIDSAGGGNNSKKTASIVLCWRSGDEDAGPADDDNHPVATLVDVDQLWVTSTPASLLNEHQHDHEQPKESGYGQGQVQEETAQEEPPVSIPAHRHHQHPPPLSDSEDIVQQEAGPVSSDISLPFPSFIFGASLPSLPSSWSRSMSFSSEASMTHMLADIPPPSPSSTSSSSSLPNSSSSLSDLNDEAEDVIPEEHSLRCQARWTGPMVTQHHAAYLFWGGAFIVDHPSHGWDKDWDEDVSLNVEDLLRLGRDNGSLSQLLNVDIDAGMRELDGDLEWESDGNWSMQATVGDGAWDVGYMADFATDTKDHNAAWREAQERASSSITIDARFCGASLSSPPNSSFAAIQAQYTDMSLCTLEKEAADAVQAMHLRRAKLREQQQQEVVHPGGGAPVVIMVTAPFPSRAVERGSELEEPDGEWELTKGMKDFWTERASEEASFISVGTRFWTDLQFQTRGPSSSATPRSMAPSSASASTRSSASSSGSTLRAAASTTRPARCSSLSGLSTNPLIRRASTSTPFKTIPREQPRSRTSSSSAAPSSSTSKFGPTSSVCPLPLPARASDAPATALTVSTVRTRTPMSSRLHLPKDDVPSSSSPTEVRGKTGRPSASARPGASRLALGSLTNRDGGQSRPSWSSSVK